MGKQARIAGLTGLSGSTTARNTLLGVISARTVVALIFCTIVLIFAIYVGIAAARTFIVLADTVYARNDVARLARRTGSVEVLVVRRAATFATTGQR